MIDRRAFLSGLAAAGALAGLSGCSMRPSATHKGTDAVPVSWVRYRIGRPAAIDPALIADEAGCVVALQLFDPLLRFDYESVALKPCAATIYRVADDARSVTFTLAEGATFSNGEAVTSASFKRAWERVVRPLSDEKDEGLEEDAADLDGAYAPHSPSAPLLELVDGYDALYRGRASELAGVRCPDDRTLVVELTEPDAEWVYTVAHPALSPVPQAALDDPEAFAEKPIGNGSFKMKRAWDGKREIRLTANKDRALGAASVEGVLFALEDDTLAAYKQFRAGNLDVCDVPIDQYKDAQDTAGVADDGRTMRPGSGVVHVDEPALIYLACNASAAPLDNTAVRIALSYAIDRETLAKKTLKYSVVPAAGPVPPCIAGDDATAWAACSYDPDRAMELLGAPYPADGAGERGLTFTLLYRKGGVQEHIADQIKEDLAAAGVDLKLKALEADELALRRDEGDYECLLETCAPTRPTPLAFAELMGEGERSAALPDAVAVDEGEDTQPTVTGMLDQARATVSVAERLDVCSQVFQLASEGMSIIPLAHPAHTKVASERIELMVVEPDGTPDLAHAKK